MNLVKMAALKEGLEKMDIKGELKVLPCAPIHI